MKINKLKEVVELIRDRIDIVEIIGSRVDLDHRNMGLCPFHNDTEPSLSVNAADQYFHCFGCGAAGDAIRFIEMYEGKHFISVLRELGQQVGVDVQGNGEGQRVLERQRAIEQVLEETMNYYESMLSPEAAKYLVEERGLNPETIKQFRIGFASDGLRDHLIDDCGLPEELCVSAGVLAKAADGSCRDFFRERIVFPFIRDSRVVFMTGRTMRTNVEPKYLNIRGPIDAIFNEKAFNKHEVILTEGIFDCLSLLQGGFKAVALHGLNLKPEYVQDLSRCKKVYICLDADDAGRKAALKLGQLLGERARIIELPDGQDPNDYMRCHSAEEFRELQRAAKTPLTMELESVPADTPRTELPAVLTPFLQRLAQLDRATAEAWVSERIRVRFDLKTKDIDAYRAIVNEYRREQQDSSDSENEGAKVKPCAMFDGLVDVVEHEGEPAFLIKEGEELRIVRTVEIDGETYGPPDSKHIPWLLANGNRVVEVYERDKKVVAEADKALFDDLVEYHKGISELPGDEYYFLFAAWVFHTYVLESVRYSPIICLFSVPERGKSRTGKGLIDAARRGIHVESLRDAYLVRIAEYWTAAVFFDVRDIWARAEKSGSEDVLLSRFEKGVRVPRVLFPDKGPHEDTVYFSTFGPTIIATNEGAHHILETRAVTIHMPETSRNFDRDVIPEDAIELKARLLAFRARYMERELPQLEKPAKGRLGDILRPLLQVIRLVRPEREEAFCSLAVRLQNERVIEKATGLEAELARAVLKCEDEVAWGLLPVKAITDFYNFDKSEREKISAHRVGRRLSAMGFEKAKNGNGSAAIRWDEGVIARICSTYGMERRSETPESPTSPFGLGTAEEPQSSNVTEEKNTMQNGTDSRNEVSAIDEGEEHVEREDWGTKLERATIRKDATNEGIRFREMDLFKEWAERSGNKGSE